MLFIKIKHIIALLILLGVIETSFAFAPQTARTDDDLRRPQLPCSELQTPPGNRLYFHSFALGVQVYRWNGASWDFVAPIANLYADEDFHRKIGFHYAGPTWESNNNSKAIARRLTGCSPDTNAIPWLLLEAISNEGSGIFNRTTYIQRVNTVGGLSPTTPGLIVGEEKRIPYTAEYYFYRARN